MPTATVTTKGQITIPKEVRKRLGIEIGDRLNVLPEEDGSILTRPIAGTVRELGGLLHRRGQRSVSIGDMDQSIARRARAKFGRQR